MEQYVILSLTKDELSELIRSAVKLSIPEQKESPKQTRLIKINDLCDLLKVSKATIHKWKKEGRIPFRRISNRVFFDLDEVLASLDRFDPKNKGDGS